MAAMNKSAEATFQAIYDRLAQEHANVIPREAMHAAVYEDIVDRCAIIASAHSPSSDDIGVIIRQVMGVT